MHAMGNGLPNRHLARPHAHEGCYPTDTWPLPTFDGALIKRRVRSPTAVLPSLVPPLTHLPTGHCSF